MSILLPFLIFAFYAIGHFYLRTARQLRHLDIEFKAPLYSHLMQTVSGVVSIRAFKWERRTERKNFGILDDSQQPSYLLYCAQRWLTFAVNMVIMVLAIVLIVVVTTLREAIGPGYIGVALSNLLAFSFTVQAIITSWVQLEVSLGAVSRVKTFATALPSEDENLLARSSSDSGLLQPPQEEWGSTWPSQGRVCIDKLVASYP
jgi:ABC-type multidrug transport system fused ATPase/permease subunit